MRKHLLCYYYIYRLLWDITFPLTGLKHLLQLLFAFPHYWSGWAAVCVYWLSLCLVFWNCIDLLFDQVIGFVKQSAHHFFILNNFQVKISVYALKMNVLNLHSKINLFSFTLSWALWYFSGISILVTILVLSLDHKLNKKHLNGQRFILSHNLKGREPFLTWQVWKL